MKTPLISVVLPIYNIESYLDRCMKAVLDQTYRNLEIKIIPVCKSDTVVGHYPAYRNAFPALTNRKTIGIYHDFFVGGSGLIMRCVPCGLFPANLR